MKILILALIGLFVTELLYAAPVSIFRRDAKFPTQRGTETQSWTNPAAASATLLATAHAGATSAAVATVTSFSTQPGEARNIAIDPGGTTGDVENCTIVVAGTNYSGASISEDFAFLANATDAVVGSKAFRTVTSVTFPANCESGSFGATWDIGTGSKLGLKNCLTYAGDFFFSLLNGAKEATAPTLVVDADEMEKNTVTFNGALDASNDFVLYFMQNFVCF